MAHRASQLALAAVRQSGEVALDYIDRFKQTGERVFTTASGERLQITEEGDFLCLHLERECMQETVCPQNHCQKLKSSPRKATDYSCNSSGCRLAWQDLDKARVQ